MRMVGVVGANAGVGPSDPLAPTDLEVRLLGSLAVTLRGAPLDLGPPKQRAVLAILALEAGRVVPTDRIVDLLWDEPGPRSTATLQTYVSNLRRILEPNRRPRDPAAVLVTEPPGYRLALTALQVDAHRLVEQVERARRLHRSGELVGALDLLDEALGAWTGLLLPELSEAPFVVDAANRFTRVRLAAVVLAGEIHLSLGDHQGALAVVEPALDDHALDEHLHALTAVALYRAGRQTEALRVIERIRRSLADEVGLGPGPELTALEADLLAQAPSLDWSPASGPRPQVPAAEPLPQPTQDRTASRLAGRESELGRLIDAWERAAAGDGGAAVVLGEPGIGKTRLLEELGALARERGSAVAWARCPESGAIPPFWPVTELSRQLFAQGVVGAALVAPLDTDGDDDPASPRTLFELYQLVITSIRSASRPILAVIDDLQWADADSLRMLAHVAGELRGSSLLLCVASRPLDAESHPALLDGLEALARTGSLHLRLDGLTVAAVGEWLGEHNDGELSSRIAALVHERTSGHPLFVKELSELLAAEGRWTESDLAEWRRVIPPGVQFVVRRRVTRLPQPTQQLLTVAAVVGRTFDLDVVASLCDLALDHALDHLEPALASGLVLAERAGAFRFSHALVAEALEAEVNHARRARIHARAAQLLDEHPEIGPEVVAHHALDGIPAGSAALAYSASVGAAKAAESRLGFEDAAAHWENAVRALAKARPTDRATRVDTLCRLSAAWFRIDRVTEGLDAAVEAMELAEASGDLDSMVRAAALIGHPHVWPHHPYGEVDPRVEGALRRTTQGLDDSRTIDRARVLGALAVEITYGPDAEWERVAAEAREAARRARNPDVLARVLLNTSGDMAPSQIERRRADSLEVIDLVEEHHLHPELELIARFNLGLTHNELGELDEATTQVLRCQQLAERLGGTGAKAQLGWFQAQLELARCNYDRALELGRSAEDLYRRTRGHDTELVSLVLQVALAADRGGFTAIAERFSSAADLSPAYEGAWHILGWLALENGWPNLAAELISKAGTLVLPDDYTTMGFGCAALQLGSGLGLVDEVARLMPRLECYAGRWAALGSGPAIVGLVDLSLARGAECTGRYDDARRWYSTAVAGHERMRTPAWLARSLLHEARFLLHHGNPGEESLARDGLDRAASIAEHHGLVPVAHQIDEVRNRR
jgi:DNA-binding SARP family transcriptional activator